jgi:hypothetical protein
VLLLLAACGGPGVNDGPLGGGASGGGFCAPVRVLQLSPTGSPTGSAAGVTVGYEEADTNYVMRQAYSVTLTSRRCS